jgi:hypothetical protein
MNKQLEKMKYVAKEVDVIEPRPNSRSGIKVGIFRVENDNEEQVGEYERNYSTLFNSFHYFQKDGKDFALYSPDYTVTRIMELPNCKDIGGEEPDTGGFCPVDYFVPTYIEQEIISETKGAMGTNRKEVRKARINNPQENALSEFVSKTPFTNFNTGEECETITTYRPLTDLLYSPFGFVAGCIWGDDSTYKIQYLDLSEAEKGIIKRDERFGYIALPENLSLKDAIDMYDYGWDEEDESANCIRINIMQNFDLSTGKITS